MNESDHAARNADIARAIKWKPRLLCAADLGQDEWSLSPEIKRFVFLDESDVPFLCQEWGGEIWLFYWHPDKKWVSLKQITMEERAEYIKRALPEEQAKLYFKESTDD